MRTRACPRRSSCESSVDVSRCCGQISRASLTGMYCSNISTITGHFLATYDLVVLSDYGKGGLAHIAEMVGAARAAGKQVLIDPKGDDYSRYAGATVVTPNLSELRAVVGHWKSESDLTNVRSSCVQTCDSKHYYSHAAKKV